MLEKGRLLKLTSIAQNLKVDGTIMVLNAIEEKMYQYLEEAHGTAEETRLEVLEVCAAIQGTIDHMRDHAESSKLYEIPDFNMGEIFVFVPNEAITREGEYEK